MLAEHISDHLSVFVVAENTDAERPANGGLRLLSYDSDATCKADGHRLASLRTNKPSLYGTGFAGREAGARAAWFVWQHPIRIRIRTSSALTHRV